MSSSHLCNPDEALFTPNLPKADCVRITVRDVSCGGASDHRHVVIHDRTVLDVFLRGHGTSWRVSGVLIDSLDSGLTGRRCPPRR